MIKVLVTEFEIEVTQKNVDDIREDSEIARRMKERVMASQNDQRMELTISYYYPDCVAVCEARMSGPRSLKAEVRAAVWRRLREVTSRPAEFRRRLGALVETGGLPRIVGDYLMCR